MKIEKLKENDVSEFCKFAKGIIAKTPYYDEATKKWEAEPFIDGEIKECLRKGTILCLLVKYKDRIVGFAYGNFSGKSGTFYLVWFGVDSNYRNKGIATNLINTMSNLLKDKGIHKIWCDTTIDNKESIGLFRKFGFHRVATLRRHWFKHDYYLWEKFL